MPGQTTLNRHNTGSHLVPVAGGVVAWTRISNGVDYTCTFAELAALLATISAAPTVTSKAASYTATATDAFTLIEFTAAGTFTLPTDAAAPTMGLQSVINVTQIGAGALAWPTATAGSTVVGGVTYDIPAGMGTPVRFVNYSWRKRAANEWVLS